MRGRMGGMTLKIPRLRFGVRTMIVAVAILAACMWWYIEATKPPASIQSVVLQPYPPPAGSGPMQEVIATIRNNSNTPIRQVYANIITHSNDGGTYKHFDCQIYAAWDSEPGIKPGSVGRVPDSAISDGWCRVEDS